MKQPIIMYEVNKEEYIVTNTEPEERYNTLDIFHTICTRTLIRLSACAIYYHVGPVSKFYNGHICLCPSCFKSHHLSNNRFKMSTWQPYNGMLKSKVIIINIDNNIVCLMCVITDTEMKMILKKMSISGKITLPMF